jgi:ferredoxin
VMVLVSVNRDTCIGCGHCTQVCPKTFELFEGAARVKNPKGDPEAKIRQAAAECPVAAITL